jgi:hypothetical protein
MVHYGKQVFCLRARVPSQRINVRKFTKKTAGFR